jgi:DNA-binding transcriptional ArsR family regulator
MVGVVEEDLVFKALADPVRRLLLDALFRTDGQSLGELEREVNTHVEMTRFGVAKHLRLLEQADLVVARKQGRQRLHHLNPVPIQQIHQRWIGKYTERAGVAAVLLDLKHRLEQPAPGPDPDAPPDTEHAPDPGEDH